MILDNNKNIDINKRQIINININNNKEKEKKIIIIESDLNIQNINNIFFK